MSVSESQSGGGTRLEEVLTLAEAAAYLRVDEEALAKLASKHHVPSKKIGNEWRFLRKALADWLRYPSHQRDILLVPTHWMLESPLTEELMLVLEERLLRKLKQSAPPSTKPGSKQAVLEHFGIFRDDQDLEERLADAKSRREAGGDG